MTSRKGNIIGIPDSQKITIHDYKELKIFDTEEIIYLEANGRYTKVYFKNKNQIICAKLLKDFESVLTINFTRIHRSYMVNISCITKIIDNKILELDDGTKLPIARRRFYLLKKRISNSMPIV